MKKLFLVSLLLSLSLAACTFPNISLARFTATPTHTSTSTLTPTSTITPTPTPTLIPTPTYTPEPIVRVAEADHSLFKGEYDTALDEYSQAQRGSDDPAIQAAAVLGQGRIHYLTGVYPNALSEFRSIIENYPASPQAADAYFFLAETYLQLQRYADAAEAFSSYLTVRPGVLDAFIHERLGDALTNDGDYTAALAAYITAAQSPRLPSDFSLELKLAQTYVILGDYTTAQVVYDDIYTRTSSDAIKAQVDYARGQMLTSRGLMEDAIAAYLDAVFNYPSAYYSYLSLVELVDIGYPVNELQRGLVNYYAGQYGYALAAFDRYLSQGPSDASTVYYYQGLIYRDGLDLPSAIALWDAVILGDQSSPVWDSAWEEKAYTQWAFMDDFTAAEATLLDFVSTAPDHSRAAEFLFDAGRVAERHGRLLDASNIWLRIPEEYPGSDYIPQALLSSAISYYRLEDFASALTVFEHARDVAGNPTELARAYFWIGKTQSALGDGNSAVDTWRQAVSFDPTGYYSERARDLLNNRLPFTPPGTIDLGIDRQSELRQAELWMQTTFNYPSGTDFSVPGPLVTDPRFIRGREFSRLGFSDLAEAEFDDMRQSYTNDPLSSFRLAVYLSDVGIYRPAILSARQVLDLAGLDDATSLTAPVLFSHIRFGAYFPSLVVPLAQDRAFHPLFIWSTIRQESLFDPSIKSSAGASGLMQIMPATGEEIYSRLAWPPEYSQSDLLRPEVNLTMGIFYLALQRDTLGGDLYAALAAYNGGPGNASAWLDLSNGDPDLFVEVVRFEETRRYLMSIYEIFTIYSRLYARVP